MNDEELVSAQSSENQQLHNLISMLLFSKCDERAAQSRDESVKELNQRFVDCLGEKIKRSIGLGM